MKRWTPRGNGGVNAGGQPGKTGWGPYGAGLTRMITPKGGLLTAKRKRQRALRRWASPAAYTPRPVRKFAAQAWRNGGMPGGLRAKRQPLKVYGSIGSLEVRLAQTKSDIRRAQRLRFQVFYREMSATPSATALINRRDMDAFDAHCDHLLVVDRDAKMNAGLRGWQRGPRVVGTYRILQQHVAEQHGGFYTQGEYNIAPLIASHPDLKFLELGRSCVLKPYRNRRSVELLWHGLWTYIRERKNDVMIGCASFAGTDPSALETELSFLYHHALAPEEWRARAHSHLHVEMNRIPKEDINPRAALKKLPPLIKGYLRLGAYVGDGAVIDHQFGTTDVLIVLPIGAIDPRYFAHFGAPDEQTSRISPEAKRMM
ncbi:MAG: GNAT family N-acyltransferase [Pseudomonadota bacterium]